ncbi:MAG: type VI secretion system protein TssL [Rhodoferax sp.]|nr:type VI secretion system protein TssL [Rhodoferax sp.]
MSTPDPFAPFESERTVIKPKPRMPSAASPSAPPPSYGTADPEPEPIEVNALGLLNPLVSCASSLLGLVGHLRTLSQAPNVEALRNSVADAVRRFEAAANRAGVSNENIVAARYVLCTALDESVSNTPWGVQAAWSKRSMLVQFHNETWGGEKVFQLLAKLAQDVSANRQLLELIYCVLALGFEGRYRVIDNGRSQLEAVRQRLADLIRKQRPPVETDLSPHWKGQGQAGAGQRQAIPFWVIGTGVATLLALVFVTLFFILNSRSDTTYGVLAGLRVPGVQIAAAPVPAKKPRLTGFLEPEIREGLVTVLEESDRSIIRLRGDRFFASGSAQPMPQTEPVLRRIAQALAEVKGDVLVVGHSDNQPIRSLRFPSNWHLSTARAENVKTAMTGLVEPTRMRSSGKADAEPLAPNDSVESRARNRRVDITLFPETKLATPVEAGK